MIPIGDYNPTRRRPVVTYGLIAINVLVFVWQLTLGDRALAQTYFNDAVVPYFISRDPLSIEALLDSLRSMFMHGGWLHLGSNMLYLWVFGDNIEDRLGRVGYVAFYLLTGFAAIAAQVLINPDSRVPMIGASGAIAGVLGGYLLLYPRAQVQTLFVWFFIFLRDIPAVFVLGLWFLLQLFSGVASLASVDTASGGVAFFAHIGGFVAGVGLMWVHRLGFGRPEPIALRQARANRLAAQRRRQARNTAQRESRPVQPRRYAFETRINHLVAEDMPAEERVAAQANGFAQMERFPLGKLIRIVTPGEVIVGQLLALTRTHATIRHTNGDNLLIPLENIRRVQ